MKTQPTTVSSKKLTLNKESIQLLTTALSTGNRGPTAIDCSITC